MTVRRIVISGASGGSGKTVLSLGLCRALLRQGLRVAAFKKGPDYIDAAWLSRACGRCCTNLDPFFLPGPRLISLFASAAQGCDMAVIEGNRGLYDGRDEQGSCSTAGLARLLDAPVLLSLNCTKMTRTAAALIDGLMRFEPLRFAGVVLAQVSPGSRHESVIRRSIETHTSARVLGTLPRLRPVPIPERHMGLVAADGDEADACLDKLADVITANVDLHGVLEAAAAGDLSAAPFWPDIPPTAGRRPRIGYVQDDVLWFYYKENLTALQHAGADLVRLRLLDDAPWPELDGLYLGGGFPELFAERLAAAPRLAEIARLARSGLPIYAECGGFMVLCRSLVVDGISWPMAGVVPADVEFCPTPQGLGYVEATAVKPNPFHPLGVSWRGHEFHYSRCRTAETGALTLELSSGTGMGRTGRTGRDGFLCGNTFAAYTHLFAPAVPHWAPRFVSLCAARPLPAQPA